MASRFLLALFFSSVGDEAALHRGQFLYREAQYTDAIVAVDEVLASPDTSPATRAEALVLVGSCQAALGNDEAARRRFRELLKVDPNAKLPAGTSPKIRFLFEQALIGMSEPPRIAPTLPAAKPPATLALQPLASTQPASAPLPIYRRWWFWTAAAVLVAGAAGTAIYFATRPETATLAVTFQAAR